MAFSSSALEVKRDGGLDNWGPKVTGSELAWKEEKFLAEMEESWAGRKKI